MTDPTPPTPDTQDTPPVDENTIIAERRAKLGRLREQGVVFPNNFQPAHRATDLAEHHGFKTREQLQADQIRVSVAGRIMLKRVQGKASFATIQDGTGRLQLWMNDEGIGADVHESFKHWDLGDIIGVEGELFKTMKGER